MQVTIGIGITTKDRPELLKALLDSIQKHTFMDNVKVYVADDSIDKVGVAKKKNECLRELKDCQHIFLMDDDIEIIKDGWIEFFVKENIGHCMYLSHKLHNFKYQKEGVKVFSDCGGVFLYMDKNAIDKVGAFNENFSPYSFEHCEWSMRWNDKKREFYMLEGTENYIYSHDYSTPNHKSSITDEEKNKCVKNNWNKFFNSQIKDVYLPL